MAVLTNIEAVTRTLAEEMRRDPNIFITGEDVGVRGGVFRATQGLIEEFGDKRVIDSPLGELSIVAIGIGAAVYGLRPVCEIQFADYVAPAFNQIVNEAARMRYRSNGTWTCPLVIRTPYGGGIGAPWHWARGRGGAVAAVDAALPCRLPGCGAARRHYHRHQRPLSAHRDRPAIAAVRRGPVGGRRAVA